MSRCLSEFAFRPLLERVTATRYPAPAIVDLLEYPPVLLEIGPDPAGDRHDRIDLLESPPNEMTSGLGGHRAPARMLYPLGSSTRAGPGKRQRSCRHPSLQGRGFDGAEAWGQGHALSRECRPDSPRPQVGGGHARHRGRCITCASRRGARRGAPELVERLARPPIRPALRSPGRDARSAVPPVAGRAMGRLAVPLGQVGGGQLERLGDRRGDLGQLAEPDREAPVLVGPEPAVVAPLPESDAEVRMALIFAPRDPDLLIVLRPRDRRQPPALLRRRLRLTAGGEAVTELLGAARRASAGGGWSIDGSSGGVPRRGRPARGGAAASCVPECRSRNTGATSGSAGRARRGSRARSPRTATTARGTCRRRWQDRGGRWGMGWASEVRTR